MGILLQKVLIFPNVVILSFHSYKKNTTLKDNVKKTSQHILRIIPGIYLFLYEPAVIYRFYNIINGTI